VEDIIRRIFAEVWRRQKGSEKMPALENDTKLLDIGLDSLAYAIIVQRLEDAVGIDPFTASETAIYPQTFGEFIAFYENHAKEQTACATTSGLS